MPSGNAKRNTERRSYPTKCSGVVAVGVVALVNLLLGEAILQPAIAVEPLVTAEHVGVPKNRWGEKVSGAHKIMECTYKKSLQPSNVAIWTREMSAF